MCMVSNIGDQFARTIPQQYPWATTPGTTTTIIGGIAREEFEALRAEVQAVKELLKAAKVYDEVTGQPDCEVEDKVELLKRVAKLVGVDLEEVFG